MPMRELLGGQVTPRSRVAAFDSPEQNEIGTYFMDDDWRREKSAHGSRDETMR
jgi:hypothetical protein